MIAPLKADLTLSQFVIVDVQSKLATAMPADAMQAVIKNCGILAQVSSMLGVPVIATEQYPKGLGNMVPELSAWLTTVHPVEKLSFSCLAEPKFSRQLTRDHTQIILAGMEAHICVLQTALDLIACGKQVFVGGRCGNLAQPCQQSQCPGPPARCRLYHHQHRVCGI